MAPETPKGISSRLLTMKFMQRAVASAASPASDSDSHSAKKRKLGHKAANNELLGFDQSAVQAAIEDRETKRQAAIQKHRGDDTHWVLNTAWDKKTNEKAKSKPLRVVYVGYGDVDADQTGSDDDDDIEDDAVAVGRMSTYKKPNEELEKEGKRTGSENGSSDDDSDKSSDGEDEDEDADTKAYRRTYGESPGGKELRDRSRSKQRSESNKAKEFRDKRKKKDVKLSGITSISSGGQSSSFGSANKSMTCYNCQQTGHKASDCPKRGSKGQSKR